MISLIAESKSMSEKLIKLSEQDLAENNIFFPEDTKKIIDYLLGLNREKFLEKLKISPLLGAKALKFLYDIPYKETGDEAIKLFNGEVYKALGFEGLSDDAKKRGYDNILIISSLYGLLKPSTLIKPYRFEYNVNMEPLSRNLESIWKPKVTVGLGKLLKQKKEKEILNLLPADAARYVDFKLIKSFAKVFKPDFKIIDDNGNVKTPSAGKLKEMRGKLLKFSIENNLTHKDLIGLDTDWFIYSDEISKKDYPVYIIK